MLQTFDGLLVQLRSQVKDLLKSHPQQSDLIFQELHLFARTVLSLSSTDFLETAQPTPRPSDSIGNDSSSGGSERRADFQAEGSIREKERSVHDLPAVQELSTPDGASSSEAASHYIENPSHDKEVSHAQMLHGRWQNEVQEVSPRFGEDQPIQSENGQLLNDQQPSNDLTFAANDAQSSRHFNDSNVGSISHASENGTIVLKPTLEQWDDFPALLRFAKDLGVSDTGICKVQLPEEARQGLSSAALNLHAKKAGRLSTFHQNNGTFGLKTVECTPAPATRLEPEKSSTTTSSTVEAYIDQYEKLLRSEEGLQNVYYYTDVYAQTRETRSRLNLPVKSPIWPLKGDHLCFTKKRVPGIHWPYAYQSGTAFGASFAAHIEDFNLFSISYLYEGEKIWYGIAPQNASALEKNLRATNPSYYQGNCSQFLRHAPTISPKSFLQKWNVSYTIVHQRQHEAVITFPRTYHQGFSVGLTVAEAVNYADADWDYSGYVDCEETCPPGYIRRDMLQFKRDDKQQLNVSQTGVGDSDSSDENNNSNGEECESSEIGKQKSKKKSTKRHMRAGQIITRPPHNSLSGRRGSRKRPSSVHDLRDISGKRPRLSIADVASILSKDLGPMPEGTIKPLDICQKLEQNLDIEHDDTLLFYSRLFYAIGSPDAFASLRDACSAAREQGVFPVKHANTLRDTIQALDMLDSTAFANQILSRHYLVMLVERRYERETYHKSEKRKTRSSTRVQANLLQPGSKQTLYDYNRPDSMSLADLMADAYPNLGKISHQQSSSDPEYQKKLKTLKGRLTKGRNWQLLKQRFLPGILALVPAGDGFGITNSE